MNLLFPGSFDPPHRGHLDLIRRAAALCELLVVGVTANPDKHHCLSPEQRVALLAAECADLVNVRVVTYRGATIAYAKEHGLDAIVRGLRNANDLELEQAMAQVNRDNGVDTLLLTCDSAHLHLSSKLVRLVAQAGLPLDALVTPRVAVALAPVIVRTG